MSIHEKWFISDTHFFQANMLKFVDSDGHRTRREFPHPDEDHTALHQMHEKMVANWNNVVGANDYVYHLGDVTMQYHAAFNGLMSRLKGKKRLIVGNHDKIWNPNLMRWFEKAEVWKGFKESNFTATHFPHRLESLRDGAFNVHGHIHRAHLEDLHYINVSVEVRDYTPVHMDTIIKEIKDAERILSAANDNKHKSRSKQAA